MHWLEAQRDEATHPKLRGLQREKSRGTLSCLLWGGDAIQVVQEHNSGWQEGATTSLFLLG